jgi:hypothetical protein
MPSAETGMCGMWAYMVFYALTIAFYVGVNESKKRGFYSLDMGAHA